MRPQFETTSIQEMPYARVQVQFSRTSRTKIYDFARHFKWRWNATMTPNLRQLKLQVFCGGAGRRVKHHFKTLQQLTTDIKTSKTLLEGDSSALQRHLPLLKPTYYVLNFDERQKFDVCMCGNVINHHTYQRNARTWKRWQRCRLISDAFSLPPLQRHSITWFWYHFCTMQRAVSSLLTTM